MPSSRSVFIVALLAGVTMSTAEIPLAHACKELFDEGPQVSVKRRQQFEAATVSYQRGSNTPFILKIGGTSHHCTTQEICESLNPASFIVNGDRLPPYILKEGEHSCEVLAAGRTHIQPSPRELLARKLFRLFQSKQLGITLSPPKAETPIPYDDLRRLRVRQAD